MVLFDRKKLFQAKKLGESLEMIPDSRVTLNVSTTFVLQRFRYIPGPTTPAILGSSGANKCERIGRMLASSFLSGYPKDVPEHMLNHVNALVGKGGDPY